MDVESPYPSPLADNFYVTSTTKLVVMSILSFGMYEPYWLYRNWQAMRKSGYKKVIPWLRVIVYPFYAYSCFQWIENTAKTHDIKSRWSAGFLAVVFFALTGTSFFLDAPYEYIGLLGFLPILVSNQLALDVRERITSDVRVDSAYTYVDMAIVLLGISFFATMFAASYLLSQIMDADTSTLFGM